MTELEMKAAVNAYKTMDYSALKQKMEFMQATHKSNHITPTHINLNMERPKSFYMKRAMVDEQQGQKLGTVGWGGKTGLVKNIVQVPGFKPIEAEDEATILYQVLRNSSDAMVFSADDSIGGKCLYVTGIPKNYAGFSYLTNRQAGLSNNNNSVGLPIEVFYNVVCIRVAGLNNKLLSTYPAHQSYIDGLGSGYSF